MHTYDFFPQRFAAVVLVSILAACSGGDEPVKEGCTAHEQCSSGLCDPGPGSCLPQETALVPDEPLDEASLDFGAVPVGETASVTILLRNESPVALGARAEGLVAPFVAAPGSLSVEPGGEGTIQVDYRPESEGRHEGILLVSSHRTSWSVRVTGRGTVATLDCPARVDFDFEVGTAPRTEIVRCANPSGLELTIRPEIEGDEGFALASAESVTVPPGEEVEFELTFTPSDFGSSTGALRLREANDALLATVNLGADSLPSELLVPQEGCLEFPRTPIGWSLERGVALLNLGAEALEVAVQVEGSSAFGVPASIVVPVDDPTTGERESEILLPVSFAPDGDATHEGTLIVETGGIEQRVCLRGEAGGARIVCEAPAVDYGRHAVALTGTREVACRNEGGDALVIEALQASDPALVASVVGLPAPEGYGAGERFRLRLEWTPLEPKPIEGRISVFTNDPIEPELVIAVEGEALSTPGCELELEPGVIDFGSVPPGTEMAADLLLENRGTDPCVLAVPPLDEADGFAVALPQVVEAGEKRLARATFAPPAEASYETQLAFQASDPAQTQRHLVFFGVAGETCLTWHARALEMGAAQIGCSSDSEALLVRNVCSHPVPVEAIDLAGAPSLWSYRSPQPLPTTLQAGETLQVEITHRAPLGLSGLAQGALWLRNGQDAVSETVQLGSVATAGRYTTAADATTGALDILWVIDTGLEMEAVEDAIAGEIATFLLGDARGLDWRMAVTRADGTGVLATGGGTGPVWLDASLPDFATRFSDYVHQSPGGTRAIGLESAYRALGSAAWGPIRAGSQLAVIYVSDKEDQSPEMASFYASHLLAQRSPWGYEQVWVHAITSGPAGCGAAAPAASYAQLADDFGGSWISICSSDWAADLGTLGQNVLAIPALFPALDAAEDTDRDGTIDLHGTPAELEVHVDGFPTPPSAASGAETWRLEHWHDKPVVRFHPSVAPPAGSRIEITYTPACIP